MWGFGTDSSHVWDFGTDSSHLWKLSTMQFFTSEKNRTSSSHGKNSKQYDKHVKLSTNFTPQKLSKSPVRNFIWARSDISVRVTRTGVEFMKCEIFG